MLPHPDTWRSLTPGLRVVIWLGASFILAALWGAYFLSGPWQAKKEEEAQAQRQRDSLSAQRRHLWLQEKALPRDSVEAKLPFPLFSALHFQSAEASLARWTPDEKGGELVLEMPWSSLPQLFTQLAEREMTPTAFMIQPEEGSPLRVTLHLEAFRER